MEAPGCRHHNIGSRYPSGAVRVCVGVFTWVPWGFTAVSPPRSSCVPRRSCSARMKLPLPEVNASRPPGLLGFLGVSPPYPCRVAPAWLGEAAWPEWSQALGSMTRMGKPGCSGVTAGTPRGFFYTRRPGFVSVSCCYLLIQDFTCSFTQRFLFLTNRKGRVSWIISAVVCLAAGRRSGKKGDGVFPRFPQGNPMELLACSLLNHRLTFFV